ncbi:membrane-spanning 4-domains subfamily A member 4A-like isoform X3 [Sphaerodactylus townsendi]|uniref:membrane-spanning 4-domains subfamily A member 4A-like isoform X3 n=1 Tax=Sphaerodactylus townsendi TaxID=933632 RepID=UPI002025C75F|nr:membrane-spanning 4-domains subfamily A member 4A-like isoform X3 [Sphaerodactylus townsendi]
MDLSDPATLASLSNSIVRPSVPRPVTKLYRGEPMALGITQILIGILEISFGLVIALAESTRSSHDRGEHIITPYWMGILYIISGSLSVAAAKDPRVPLVKGVLAMNVVSSVAAGIAIVILSISIAHPRYYYDNCNSYYLSTMPPDICREYVTIPSNLTYEISALLLAVTILEFLIAITTAAFGCASVCRNAYSETTVVIFQKTDEGIVPASAFPRQMNEDVEA